MHLLEYRLELNKKEASINIYMPYSLFANEKKLTRSRTTVMDCGFRRQMLRSTPTSDRLNNPSLPHASTLLKVGICAENLGNSTGLLQVPRSLGFGAHIEIKTCAQMAGLFSLGIRLVFLSVQDAHCFFYTIYPISNICMHYVCYRED